MSIRLGEYAAPGAPGIGKKRVNARSKPRITLFQPDGASAAAGLADWGPGGNAFAPETARYEKTAREQLKNGDFPP